MKFFTTIILLTAYFGASAQSSYFDATFTDHFKQNGSTGWNASDGTISLELPDGRNMWFMGDSHINQGTNSSGDIPCLFNTRNCIVVQDADDRSSFETFYNPLGGNPYTKQFIRLYGDDDGTYWPGDAIVKDDTLVYSFWHRYISTYDPVAEMEIPVFQNTVIAKIKIPEIELQSVTAIPYPLFEYGRSIIWNDTDSTYYIYGKFKLGSIFKPVLAKCSPDNLLGPWEFYTDSGWSDTPYLATAIGDEVSAAYSVFKLNNKYHLFYQENGYMQSGLGTKMYIYSADDPWGPFDYSNRKLVYTIDTQFGDNLPISYNGEAHPQFIENGELLISYNVNRYGGSPCFSDGFAFFDPNEYRPKFARVPICEFSEVLTVECEDRIVYSDAPSYTIIDDELNPVITNCKPIYFFNNYNNSTSLNGASIQPGLTTINWGLIDTDSNFASCSQNIFVVSPSVDSNCNLLTNGDFTQNSVGWNFFNVADNYLLQECYMVPNVSAGAPNSATVYSAATINLDQGSSYELSFYARSDSSRSMQVNVTGWEAVNTAYCNSTINLETNTKKYTCTFSMTQASTTLGFVEFLLGASSTRVIIDKVLLKEVGCVNQVVFDSTGEQCKAVSNGDFNDGLTEWSNTNCTPAVNANVQCEVNQIANLPNPWDCAIAYSGFELDAAASYQLSFEAKGISVARGIFVKIGSQNYPFYLEYEPFNISTEMTNYAFSFIVSDTMSIQSNLEFHFGGDTNGIVLDNIRLEKEHCDELTVLYLEDCHQTLYLEGNINSDIYSAADKIICNGTIQSNQHVTLKAANEIQLGLNFATDSSSTFSVEITPCE